MSLKHGMGLLTDLQQDWNCETLIPIPALQICISVQQSPRKRKEVGEELHDISTQSQTHRNRI